MNERVSLRVPCHTFHALAAYLHESGSGADIEDLAATAIGEWVAQARAHAAAGGAGAARGYQWKSLLLPDGSRLRMYFEGTFHYAEVKGDQLIFGGRSVSPAQMANAIAGATRNAWRDLWILMPGETAWKLASVRRQQARNIEKAVAAPAIAVAGMAVPGMAAHGMAGPGMPAHGMAGPDMAAPGMAAPVMTGPAEALLRRLAVLLEQTLEARKPQYRRRTDALPDVPFDDG